jgi:hypothetical protein
LNGTSANFSGDLTLTGTNPRFYLTDSDNNPDYFISNTDGTFTVYDVTNSVSRFTIGTTGNGTFGGNLTVGQIIRSGGTSSQFLKADGSVDSTAYVRGSGAIGYYARFTSSGIISDGFINTDSNITYVSGMGLSTLNGIDINGNFGAGTGGLKIRSFDETTGKAYINFINTDGVFRLGIEGSTGGGILPGSTAYATVFTSGLTGKNLEFGTNNAKRLTLDGTTGAATFTSTISANGATLTGALSGTSATFVASSTYTNFLIGSTSTTGAIVVDANRTNLVLGAVTSNKIVFNNASTTQNGYIYSDSAELSLGYPASGTFNVQKSGVGNVFSIASSGAATFSSSVKSNTLFSVGTGSGKFFGVGSDISGSFASTDLVAYNTGGDLYLLSTGAVGVIVKASTGNVGIGTTSPGAKLTIQNDGASLYSNAGFKNTSSTAELFIGVGGSSVGATFIQNNAYLINGGASALILGTSDTERMRITSSGNVGIGTTTPDDYGSGYKMLSINGSTAGILQLRSNNNPIINIVGTSASADFEAFINKDITFKTGTSSVTERMRITSGGQLMVNTNASVYSTPAQIEVSYVGSTRYGINLRTTTGDGIPLNFVNQFGSQVGYIYCTNTATQYTTSSDYRLKEDLKPIKGLEIVNKINVYDYKWKSEDSRMDGVLAHELAEILPYAVSGVKDGEQMQSVDYSKIVPVMVQAIKELKAELDTLKNK